MKKIVTLLALILCFYVLVTKAITPFAGHWEGIVTREGKDWQINLDISQTNKIFKGTIDAPDYGLYAIPLTKIELIGDKIQIEHTDRSGRIILKGLLKGKSIRGQWEGLDVSANFFLKRISKEPITFIEEDVHFQNGEANLSGTLIKPKKVGKYPAIVFTHGSGNQTRTEDFYRSRAYLCARYGIAALIYDRRGKGESRGGGDKISFINLADDAIAAVNFLRNRQDIKANQIGIGGFSQGGYVSPLAAMRSKNIAFVVVGSAPGISPNEQNDFSVKNALRAKRLPDETVEAVINLRKRIRDYQYFGTGNKTELEAEINKFRKESWFRNTLLPEEHLEIYSEQIKEYLSFNPVPVWENVHIPVLAVWGEKDSFVPAAKSRYIFETALKKAQNKNYVLKIFPDSGHGLPVIRGENAPWDWERLAPGYQELLIQWLSKTIRTIPNKNIE